MITYKVEKSLFQILDEATNNGWNIVIRASRAYKYKVKTYFIKWSCVFHKGYVYIGLRRAESLKDLTIKIEQFLQEHQG
mgnify:CR=1 FL=1